MAKQRYINTRFWHDTFVRENLNPLDRYLFLYFLTNDKTNICGIYELPISIIASETGIEKEMLVKMFKRLRGKVDYVDGWIVIKNFQKYQNTDNPKIKTGIEAEMAKIPSKIRGKIGYPYPIDTQSHSNSNSNSNTNTAVQKALQGNEINEIMSLFKEVNPLIGKYYGNKSQRVAIQRMLKVFGRENLEVMIKVLPQVNGKPYWPKSTTPCQLENNIPIYKAKNTEEKLKVKDNNKVVFI